MSSLIPFVVATLGALAMALAFPKTNATPLAPLGAAGLFWAWFGVSPKRAFWIGWVAGLVYFGINFAWFAETAGALIAPFGFIIVLGPAAIEALLGFALTGALVAYAARALGDSRRMVRAAVPLAAAAAFAFMEWLRAEGLGELGVPFASLGYTQVATPFAPLAAFIGTYGVTFALCVLGAYAAYLIRQRAVPGAALDTFVAFMSVSACVALAWFAWPARTLGAPGVRVAAVQGNIPQAFKFVPGALPKAVVRYETLTLKAAAAHPAIIVWPETVIPAATNTLPALQARFSTLARRSGAVLVIGTIAAEPGGVYNVLDVFGPDGTLDRIYRKRQLVPFAEHLPFAPLLGWIPWTANISHFGEGARDGIFTAGDARFGPIVCWESAFTKYAAQDVRNGADALVVATDDAWFGSTAGPYMHAQIAQMRAIETGRWIVRAASTGVSGIVAPNGRYTLKTPLNVPAVIVGTIGAPVATLFPHIGAVPIVLVFALAYLAIVPFARGRR